MYGGEAKLILSLSAKGKYVCQTLAVFLIVGLYRSALSDYYSLSWYSIAIRIVHRRTPIVAR